MAVLSATRQPKKKGAKDDANTTTLKEVYLIKVQSKEDDQAVILNSNIVPQVGDPHPSGLTDVVIKSRSLEPTDSQEVWHMTISYDDKTDSGGGGGGGGGGGDLEVLKVTIGSWKEEFVQEYDWQNKAIVDSAGSKIKYIATRPQPMVTIKVVTKDPELWRFVKITGLVNSGPVRWLGFDFKTDQLMFEDYNTSSMGNQKWESNFIFKGRLVSDQISKGTNKGLNPNRDKGWQPQLLDAGFWEIVNGERKPINVTTTRGDKPSKKPVTQPWPLNGGVHIPIDDIDKARTFLEFQTFQRTNFGVFNFDFNSLLTKAAQKRNA